MDKTELESKMADVRQIGEVLRDSTIEQLKKIYLYHNTDSPCHHAIRTIIGNEINRRDNIANNFAQLSQCSEAEISNEMIYRIFEFHVVNLTRAVLAHNPEVYQQQRMEQQQHQSHNAYQVNGSGQSGNIGNGFFYNNGI